MSELTDQINREDLARRTGPVVAGRVGTRQGRLLEVLFHPGPRVVQLRDPSVPQHSGVFAELNGDQAAELRDALNRALT
jgi:hypothetical protein